RPFVPLPSRGRSLLARERRQSLARSPPPSARPPVGPELHCLRLAKAVPSHIPSSRLRSSDEPAYEPQRLLHYPAPLPGPESRGNNRPFPKTLVIWRRRNIRSDAQAIDARLDRKAPARSPDASGITQISQSASAFDRRPGDREQGQWDHRGGGFHA